MRHAPPLNCVSLYCATAEFPTKLSSPNRGTGCRLAYTDSLNSGMFG